MRWTSGQSAGVIGSTRTLATDMRRPSYAPLCAHGHGQLDGQPAGHRAADRAELTGGPIVAEHHVAGEAHVAEVLDALGIAIGGIDLVADVLRECDLRCRDLVRLVDRLAEARVYLEMDVRPAARV